MSPRPLLLATAAALLVAFSASGRPAAAMPRAAVLAPPPPPVKGPRPAPTAQPARAPATPAPPYLQPTAEGTVATWALPFGPGQGYDLSFTRPTWFAEGGLWWGNLGIAGGATAFNTTYAPFRTTPFFEATTWMVDALIQYRVGQSGTHLFAGYRGIGQADLNFATAGFAVRRAIADDWLFVSARGQGGHSLASSYVLDGRVAVEAYLEPLSLHLGFRHMTLQAGANPVFHVNGPTAGLGLAF
jgi:hypothetical protein